MSRRRVLALDAMGVVFATRSITREVVGPFLAARGCAVDPADLRALYEAASLGRIPADDLWRRLGADPAWEDACLEGYRLMPGIVRFLETARARVDKLILLSNDVSRWSAKLRRRFDLDRWFDACLISGDLGVRKPDPAAFAALTAAAGTSPGEILFVDDKADNVAAATRAGQRAILLAPDPSSVGPGVVVEATLDELRGRLFG